LFFSGRLWHDIHDLKGIIEHHPFMLVVRSSFPTAGVARALFVPGLQLRLSSWKNSLRISYLPYRSTDFLVDDRGRLSNLEWMESRFSHKKISHTIWTILPQSRFEGVSDKCSFFLACSWDLVTAKGSAGGAWSARYCSVLVTYLYLALSSHVSESRMAVDWRKLLC